MGKLEKNQRWDLLASVSLGIVVLIGSQIFARPHLFFQTVLSLFGIICIIYGFSPLIGRTRTVSEMAYTALFCGVGWSIIESIRIHMIPASYHSWILCLVVLPILVVGGISAVTAILRHRNIVGKLAFIIILGGAFAAREPTFPLFPFLLALFQIPFLWTRKLERSQIYRLMVLSIIFLIVYLRGIFFGTVPLLNPEDQWGFPAAGAYSAAAAIILSMAWVIILRGLYLPLKPQRIRTRLRWAFLFNFLVPFTLISFISAVTLLFLIGGYQIASAKRLLYRYGIQANEQAYQMWTDFTGTEPGREPPAPVPFKVAGAFMYKNGSILDFGDTPSKLMVKLADETTKDVEFFTEGSEDADDWTLWIGGFHRGSDGSGAAICYRIDEVMLEHIREILGMDMILIKGLDIGLFPFQTNKGFDESQVIRSTGKSSSPTYPIGAILISPAGSQRMEGDRLVLDSINPLATMKVMANQQTLARSLMRVEKFSVLTRAESADSPDPSNPAETDAGTGESEEVSDAHSINVLNYLVLIFLAVLGGLLVGLIILSVATSHLISRKINLSVRLLKIGMTQLNQGNLDHQIPVVTDDELGELAGNFNTMTGSLKKYQSERENLILEKVEQDRMKKEFETARLLQNSLLPVAAPDVPYLEIAGVCRAADIVGGDYYDYIDLPDGKLGLAIGDVSGHSMSAGILMSMAKSCIFNQVRISHGVEDVIHAVNHMTFASFNLKRMMTFLYAIFQDNGRTLNFASAGHHFPYLFRPKDGTLVELESISYPLGVREELTLQTRSVNLFPGDLLVFYTDGIVETQNPGGELLGFDRFETAIRRLAPRTVDEILQGLLEMADDFRGDHPERDDCTIVVVRVREDQIDDG